MTFVPGNCTSELQPLDISVNGGFKTLLKDKFTDWYSDRLCNALRAEPDDFKVAAAKVSPDLRLSMLKPVHARWVMDCFAELQLQVKTIPHGWKEPGIDAAVFAACSQRAMAETTRQTVPPRRRLLV